MDTPQDAPAESPEGTAPPAEFDFDAVAFATSDHHFGHERIIALSQRPFASLDDMHSALIANWNAVVGPEDVVLHLGDLALGNREESIALTGTLNGHKYLVPGNHDPLSTVYKCSTALKRRTLDTLAMYGWEVLPELVAGTRGGRRILASHYPYAGSPGSERHASMHPADAGLPLLHGHTHNRGIGMHGHMFHVGVDGNAFTPVAMTTIDAWLATLPT